MPDDVWQIVQAYLEKCDAQLTQIRKGLEQAHRDLLALIATAEENEQKREKVMGPTPSFTCPRCGKTSFHPEDVKQGYCGNCHEFTGEKTNARFQA